MMSRGGGCVLSRSALGRAFEWDLDAALCGSVLKIHIMCVCVCIGCFFSFFLSFLSPPPFELALSPSGILYYLR